VIPGSYPTVLGGRQVGHHIQFQPSGVRSDYGDPDPTRYIWKVTNTGVVFYRPQGAKSTAYVLIYDAPSKTRLYRGVPGGFFHYGVGKHTVFPKAEKAALDANTVASFPNATEAEAYADSIAAGAAQRLAAASAQVVAPKYDVTSGEELFKAFDEADAVGRDARQADRAKFLKQREKAARRAARKKELQTNLIWGAGALAVLGLGYLLFRKRGAVTQFVETTKTRVAALRAPKG
jgi:hypothetical protein